GQEGTCVVPAEVPVERVVGVGRVGGVEVRGQGVAQGTASAVGGVDHLVLTAVEVFGVGRVAACSSPATGGEEERRRRAERNEAEKAFSHRAYLSEPDVGMVWIQRVDPRSRGKRSGPSTA